MVARVFHSKWGPQIANRLDWFFVSRRSLARDDVYVLPIDPGLFNRAGLTRLWSGLYCRCTDFNCEFHLPRSDSYNSVARKCRCWIIVHGILRLALHMPVCWDIILPTSPRTTTVGFRDPAVHLPGLHHLYHRRAGQLESRQCTHINLRAPGETGL